MKSLRYKGDFISDKKKVDLVDLELWKISLLLNTLKEYKASNIEWC